MQYPGQTELDRTSFVEFRDRILVSDEEGVETTPRSYPGYPRWVLPHARPRFWPSLDRVLTRRRCRRRLGAALPSSRTLGRLLTLSHGCHATEGRGPTPTAGGLQALELYATSFASGWLPSGVYHYDRVGHHLSQLVPTAGREVWNAMVPSAGQVEGGALLWTLVGDSARVKTKYGDRGERFLLLEAGHLMQNLCVVSESLGLTTVPLGGFFERDIARVLCLPGSDRVLYLGLAGRPVRR
jgi:SagB-type dehydrogenase family enzyme